MAQIKSVYNSMKNAIDHYGKLIDHGLKGHKISSWLWRKRGIVVKIWQMVDCGRVLDDQQLIIGFVSLLLPQNR